LLGLKLYFFYMPLLFLGYAFVRDEADLDKFLVINIIVAAVIAAVGIIQATVDPNFLNPANLAPELQDLGRNIRVSPISQLEMLRPASVFVSAGRFSTYMVQAFILGLGGAAYLFLRRRPARLLVLVALGLVTVGAVMSGSRSCFVGVAVSAMGVGAAIAWGAPWRSGKALALLRTVRRALLVAVVAVALSACLFPHALSVYFAEYSESLNPNNEESDFLFRLWEYPLSNLKRAFSEPNWLIGNGTGLAGLGTQYVAQFLNTNRPDLWVENGFGCLVVEMGIIAPFLWLWWTASAVRSCWRTARRIKGSTTFPLGFALFWFVLFILGPMTWGGLVHYQNFVSNAFFWLFMGILFRLPSLTSPPLEDRKLSRSR
jgi:hypothetical protein